MQNERNRTSFQEGIIDETIADEDSTARNEGEEPERPSSQSPSETHTTVSRQDGVCNFCKGDKTVVASSSENGEQKMHCRSCGEEFVVTPGSVLLEEPAAAAAINVNSLPNIPCALLIDNTTSSSSGRSLNNGKTPRQGECNFAKSVQVPGKTTLPTTLFLIEQNHAILNRSQRVFYLCFVPSEKVAEVYERISTREHDAIIRPFRDESLRFENYFQELLLLSDDQMVVSFQLANQPQGKFSITFPVGENVISLYDVQSRSQSRICPGARVSLGVECTGAPGELCEGRIRATVVNATGTHNIVFSIMAIGPTE